MRLIDADAFKEYIKDGIDGLILPKDQVEKVIAVTKSFLKDIDEQPTVKSTPHVEFINDIRSMICKVNDYYGYTDSMHMFKVLFDQKYHGWICRGNDKAGNGEYKAGDAENNVKVAVKKLREAYWSNDPASYASQFCEAEQIITSAICFLDYTLQKEGESN